MLKLRRLRIDRYPQVKPGTELRFCDGVNVIMGLPASGKTTLLDLIARLISFRFHGLESEDLDLAYDLETEDGRYAVTLRNHAAQHAPTVEGQRAAESAATTQFQTSMASATQFALRFTPSAGSAREPYSVAADEHDLKHLRPDGSVLRLLPGALVFERHSQKLRRGSSLLHGPWPIRGARTARLDQGLEWLQETLGQLSLAAEFEGAQWTKLFGDLIPEGILDWAMSAEGTLDQRGVSLEGEDLGLLAELAAALGCRRVSLDLRLKEVRVVAGAAPGRTLRSFGDPVFYFTRHDGSVVTLAALSVGQQRLVAFRYYLALYPAILIADELHGGMPYAQLTECFQGFADRQVFLSAQSPLLLDFVGWEGADQFRAGIIRCRRARDGVSQRDELVWNQLSQGEAEEVQQDYRIGLKHSGEVLGALGL